MKKLFPLLLALILVMSLCACGEKPAENDVTEATAPEENDDFVISVSAELADRGLRLSENEDASDPKTELTVEPVKDITNTTYDWLPADVDSEAYGSHNGKDYIAYTFNLVNNGAEDADCVSALRITKATNGTEDACRIMVFRNGEPAVYAKKNLGTTTDNGSPEPFESISAADKPLEITEFADDTTVFKSDRVNLKPGETEKFTVVIWIEGLDPECMDTIRGGMIVFKWDFE